MKLVLITLTIGVVGVIIVNGASLSKSYKRPQSEYDENSCPRRCSEIYNPLCGINQAGDTKVFVNDCYMSMENCNQLTHTVYYATDESDCSDFEEWISDDTIRRRLNI